MESLDHVVAGEVVHLEGHARDGDEGVVLIHRARFPLADSSSIARTTALTVGSKPVFFFASCCRFTILSWSDLVMRVETRISAFSIRNTYRNFFPLTRSTS